MHNVTFVKLIATVSQCLAKETILSKLINFVNVFRVNVADRPFDDSQKKYIDTIMKLDNSKTIMLETKGEEVKVQNFKEIALEDGDHIAIQFSGLREEGTDAIFVNYPYLAEIGEGVQIGFTDSDVMVEVEQGSEDGVLQCIVKQAGSIHPAKQLKFLNYKPKLSFLSEKDKKDVIWGLQSGVNLIAASSVKKPEDVQSIRDFLQQNGGEGAKIFVRVHTKEAYEHIDEVIAIADGIICSHGPLSDIIPGCKDDSFALLTRVKDKGKPFVVCIDAQTYEKTKKSFKSLIQRYVDEGIDSFMVTENIVPDPQLQDTIIAIQSMISDAEIEKKHIERTDAFSQKASDDQNVQNYLIYKAYKMAEDLPIRAIICYTDTGQTVSKLVSLRPVLPIIVFTKNDFVYRYVNMLWGVKGYKISQNFNYASFKRIGKEMIRILFKGNISLDDKIAILQANEDGVAREQQGDMINGIELYKFKNI